MHENVDRDEVVCSVECVDVEMAATDMLGSFCVGPVRRMCRAIADVGEVLWCKPSGLCGTLGMH